MMTELSRPRMNWIAVAVCLAMSVTGYCEVRSPVPSEAERAQTLKLLREIYQDDYRAATTTAQKSALAE